jgi:hypothetical protein
MMLVLKFRVTFSNLMSLRCHQVAVILKAVSPTAAPSGCSARPCDDRRHCLQKVVWDTVVKIAHFLNGPGGGGTVKPSYIVGMCPTARATR